MSSFRFSLAPILVALTLAYTHDALQPAWSQNSASSGTIALALESQPLNRALNELARQADMQLIYTPDMLSGLQAPALHGNYSLRQALDQLLAGSGLSGSIDGTNILIRRLDTSHIQDTDETRTLSAITVAGAYLPTTAEEAATNYTVRRSSNATKLDLSIKETPQSLSIFTQKQIEDQNLFQVVDILKNTPGVSVQEFGVPGAGRATFYSRGYAINNFQIDGMPTTASMFGGADMLASMDTALYERVEIIRGSTGLTTGTGDPSASINFVRKRPGYEPLRQVSLSYGTHAKRRAEVDLSQPFNESGTLRGRIVGVASEGNHWMERVHEKTRMFYGIAEADITDNTTLALSYTRFSRNVDDATPHGSALRTDTDSIYQLFGDKGRHFNSATQWSYAKQDTTQWFVDVRHHFNDNWSLSAAYQHTNTTPDRVYGMVGIDWYKAITGEASLSYGRIKTENSLHNLDLTLLGKFELWGRDAQIAAGFNGYKGTIVSPSWWSEDSASSCRMPSQITFDDWNNGGIPIPMCGRDFIVDIHGPIYENREKQYGAFLSAKLKPLERLTLILGTRYHAYDLELTALRADRSQTISDQYPMDLKHPKRFIPYAGIIFDLTSKTSLYASYTGIHKDQAYVRGVTQEEINAGMRFRLMPPKKGNTVEIGLKSALADDSLNIQAALFRMRERNAPYVQSTVTSNGDPQRLACYNPFSYSSDCTPMEATDGPTVTGLELSVAGQLTQSWLINAGYTYLHLKPYDTSLFPPPSWDDLVVQHDFNRPKHTFSLFTTHKFGDRLTLGGGVRWKSRTIKSTHNFYTGRTYDFSQGSHAIYDLMARYELNKHLTLGVNVNNVFDKTYFANNAASYFGAPRNVSASLGMKF
ncbi:TonB-dependent receptor [Pseudomonas sp. S 311-6]|uniref:TonB-dependent siderophore receptor n=1 Tax=Kerstersia gyiorum TaxID=206506 RepID=UPI002096C723|nr:TonB-dependent receptor [Kerstersia gyiorum]MCO7635856.1 TonB-dependent receptor [Pseudomonas sp. S 311-6]MCR4157550.1 TonB-dependent receptor [Kerstersia gyiorum]